MTRRCPLFDLVWAADFWHPAAVAELRRVLRPGGRLVVSAFAGHWQTYPFDPDLDLRVRLAEREGLRRWHASISSSDASSIPVASASLAPGGPIPGQGFAPGDAWTTVVERRHPVPAPYVRYRTQDFALSSGPFVADHACTVDWQRLTQLWDPRAETWLFARTDAHLFSAVHYRVWSRDERP